MKQPLPGSRADFLDTAALLTPLYFPSEATTDYAASLKVAGLLGPVGIGKSTLMDKLVTEDPDKFVVSGNRTSRDPRDSDGPRYHYYNLDNPDDRDEVMHGISDGDFLQVISHPATKEIYGSTRADYDQQKVNLNDIVPGEFYKLRRAELFGDLQGVYLVAPSFDVWQSRLHKQARTFRPNEYAGRMKEAHDSLTRCLDDSEMPFLINSDLDTTHASLRKYILEGDRWSAKQQTAARGAAHRLLRGIIDSGALKAA